jgi:GGDEF domain-containing protein
MGGRLGRSWRRAVRRSRHLQAHAIGAAHGLGRLTGRGEPRRPTDVDDVLGRSGGQVAALATTPAPHVFPAAWRWSGVIWWVVTGVVTVVVVATTPTTLPFMARVVLAAGLDTIPGLAVSRLLVRRSFPSVRRPWWRWLDGLRCFFVYGYVATFVLMAQWVLDQPRSSIEWGTTRTVAIAFGAAATVLWGLVVRDTVRHGLGRRDRIDLIIDGLLGLVVVAGPVAAVVESVAPLSSADVLHVLAVLRPLDAGFGVAAGTFWCAALLQLLRTTAGLRARVVDIADIVGVVVGLGAPTVVLVGPAVARHTGQLWLTVPLLFLAMVLPGMVCMVITVMARVSDVGRRGTGVGLVVLLVVSVADAWCQLLMLLGHDRLPVAPVIGVAVVNFGLFLVVPLFERRRAFEGLGRLGPDDQLRRWDVAPTVVGVGAVALAVEAVVAGRDDTVMAVLAPAALGVLVLVGVVRHHASLGEARRLHVRIQRMTDELSHQARMDALTGLWNRRVLVERFPQIVRACEANGTTVSVVMLDLDHFKRFNDRHGHVAGDQLLRVVAHSMLRVLRRGDLAARYGGEEFCLVLPATDAAEAVALLGRLRTQTPSVGVAGGDPAGGWRRRSDGRSPGRGDRTPPPDLVAMELAVVHGGVRGARGADPTGEGQVPAPLVGPAVVAAAEAVVDASVTFSAGVAEWQRGEDFDEVVQRADDACYAAKAAGRDRVVVAGAPASA